MCNASLTNLQFSCVALCVQEYAIEYGGYQNDAYDNYWRVHTAWSDLAGLPPVESAA